MTLGRLLPSIAVTALAAAFVVLNRGETVVVNLGVARFYQVPLTVFAFLSFLVGMLAMFAMSLRHDLHVRRTLRERGMLAPPRGRAPETERTEDLSESPAFEVPGGGDDFSR